MRIDNMKFVLLTAFALVNLVTMINAQVTVALSSQLCAVVNDVRGVIGILAVVLFIVGGALFAIAHFMPQAGNLRQSMQGWSLGIIVGGIVGVILVVAAPFVLNLIISVSGGNTITSVGC